MRYLLIILLMCSMCFGSDWYVSTAGAGSKNGTSAANAWDTFANITWGAGGVIAGDTLYVIGTVTNQMTVGASGSAGLPITIRGDASGQDAGVITSQTTGNPLGGADDWVQVGATNTYAFQTVNLEPTMFWLNGTRMTFVEWDTDAATTAAVMDTVANCYSVDTANKIGYVRLTSNADPDTLGADKDVFGVSRNFQHGITMTDKSYIMVTNLTFQKNTQQAVIVNASDNVLISDVIVENCTVTSTGRFGIVFNNTDTDSANRMTNMVARNNTITDCGRSGLKGSLGMDGTLFEGTTLSVCGWWGDGVDQGSNQISIGASNNPNQNPINCIIRGNISSGAISFTYSQAVIAGGAADGTELEGIGIMMEKNSADFIVEYNICYDNQSTGIRVNRSDGHTLRHNICYGNGKLALDSGHAGGIDVFQHDGNPTRIYNNTLYNNQAGITVRNEEGTGSLDIKNNIVSSSVTYDFRMNFNNITDFSIDNNCYFNASVANNFYDINGATTYDFAAWQTQISDEASSIESDPKFINPTTDFHLGSNSPCLGIGRFNEEYPLGRNRYNKFGVRR